MAFHFWIWCYANTHKKVPKKKTLTQPHTHTSQGHEYKEKIQIKITSPELLLESLWLVVLRGDRVPRGGVLWGCQETQVLERGCEGPVPHSLYQLQHQRLHHSAVFHQALHNTSLDHQRRGRQEEVDEMYQTYEKKQLAMPIKWRWYFLFLPYSCIMLANTI